MKKVFSTVAMAMVAFVAVVTMASCSNDDTSAFNAAPVVPTTQATSNSTSDATLSYVYKASLTNDVFKLFDVTITRTAGTDVKTYTFTNSTDMQDAMTTGSDVFTANNGVKVSVKATLTLKADYQETLDKVAATGTEENPATLTLKVLPGYDFAVLNSSMRHNGNRVFGGVFYAEKLDQEALATVANTMSAMLSPDNTK